MTTQELRELLETIDGKLQPIRDCIASIDSGEELDVDDHYDCSDDLRDLARYIEENC